MALPRYLAQTAAEMAGNPITENLAYLACHFSPGGKGLSNLPEALPPEAMLILDDSSPMDTHDPEVILTQLFDAITIHHCDSLLLDFQRINMDGQQKLAKLLCESLPCPVGVSATYGKSLNCPVFLSPVPLDMPLSHYLAPWQGREIWLEAALDGLSLNLSEAGCTASPLFDFPAAGLPDETLHCHYSIENTQNTAIFRLWRTKPDLDALLETATGLGVKKSIGLWQELGR